MSGFNLSILAVRAVSITLFLIIAIHSGRFITAFLSLRLGRRGSSFGVRHQDADRLGCMARR